MSTEGELHAMIEKSSERLCIVVAAWDEVGEPPRYSLTLPENLYDYDECFIIFYGRNMTEVELHRPVSVMMERDLVDQGNPNNSTLQWNANTRTWTSMAAKDKQGHIIYCELRRYP